MDCFCNCTMEKILIEKKEFYSCPNCDYLKKVEILSSADEKKRYDFHCCDENYKRYMKDIFMKLREILGSGLSLDYGCGKIHILSDILNENGMSCMYYDLYYFPQIPDNTFDNIILIEVFEHISDIYQALQNLKKRLNPNGKIIIMTQPQPKDLEHWWYLRDETHISFVTNKTMSILANMLDMNLEFIRESSIFVLTRIS